MPRYPTLVWRSLVKRRVTRISARALLEPCKLSFLANCVAKNEFNVDENMKYVLQRIHGA